MKPFSTYPEDRQKLLDLAESIESARDDEDFRNAAYELSDLVKAIITDEAVAIELAGIEEIRRAL